MSRFKAIIFDLDGTLLDSLEDIADSMNLVLESCGFPTHPIDAYKYFIGDGMDILVKRTLPGEKRNPDILKKCLTAMKKIYSKQWAAKTHPYPGIASLLNRCKVIGLKMGILSNKPDDATQATVNHFLLPEIFAAIHGARPNIPKKPHSLGAKLMAGQLGVEPEECIFLGDMPVDMQTAVAAGMYPVGALWGMRTASELSASGAKMLAVTPADLADWL
ncbi:MAG: HAD family hydrolase [Desulfobacterales bacterium]|nr:HAD family hydrolase [Desulfobacterales bacterium]